LLKPVIANRRTWRHPPLDIRLRTRLAPELSSDRQWTRSPLVSDRAATERRDDGESLYR
jgi:hypothetical protein